MSVPVDTVIFDLGGVLIDWNPRRVYRDILKDEAEVDWFLREVLQMSWVLKLDSGMPVDDALAEAVSRHPDRQAEIEAFRDRWTDMLDGPIDGVPEIMAELDDAGVPLYAITNFNQEMFPIAEPLYPDIARFKDIAVSGRLGMIKPDPAIYRWLIDRNRLDPARAVFIDDVPRNVEAAREVGMKGHHFTDAERLRRELQNLGLPV